MDRTLRTILPPIVGYLIFKICDYLFEGIFPLDPVDDLSTPGIVFLMEYVAILLWFGIVFVFQYYVIVPKTIESIKRAVILTIIIGTGIGLIFSLGHYFLDKGSIEKSIITFFRLNVQFDSFFLGNIAIIGIFNLVRNRRTKNNKA